MITVTGHRVEHINDSYLHDGGARAFVYMPPGVLCVKAPKLVHL
jgi:hypothetical protein